LGGEIEVSVRFQGTDTYGSVASWMEGGGLGIRRHQRGTFNQIGGLVATCIVTGSGSRNRNAIKGIAAYSQF